MPPKDFPSEKGPEGVQLVNPLEIPNWDTLLGAFPDSAFFHTAAWAQVLHSTYRYNPLYFILGTPQKPEALLPIMELNSWVTGRRGVSLPFTDAIEPLAADASAFQRLARAALLQAKNRQWKYLEYRGAKKWLGDAPISTSYFSHLLTLSPDESAQFGGCHESVRRAVRKADRGDLTIEFSQSLDATKAFYALLCQTRKRHGVPTQPFSFFANIQRHVLAQNQGWVVLARKGPTPVAGAVYFHHGRTALYKFGASDENFQQLRANNLVMWRAIQWYAGKGFGSLDFGRSSLDNEGLRRFKLSWGTREERIDYFRYDLRKTAFVTVQDKSSGWHSGVFRIMPQVLCRLTGKMLYRHLG